MVTSKRLLKVLVAAVLLYLWAQVMFQASFYGGFHSPGLGWDCWPTWNFDYRCSTPDGKEFGGRW